VRKVNAVLSRGTLRWAEFVTPSSAVLAFHRETPGEAVLALHNLEDQPQVVEIVLPETVGGLSDLFNGQILSLETRGRLALTLAPYEYRWLAQLP